MYLKSLFIFEFMKNQAFKYFDQLISLQHYLPINILISLNLINFNQFNHVSPDLSSHFIDSNHNEELIGLHEFRCFTNCHFGLFSRPFHLLLGSQWFNSY